MNLKEAKKVKPGAIVRMSWEDQSRFNATGIILSKEYFKGKHMAKGLSQWKEEKYDLKIHWFKKPHYGASENPCVMENWQVMVVSHV